jgi:hypothetical protein
VDDWWYGCNRWLSDKALTELLGVLRRGYGCTGMISYQSRNKTRSVYRFFPVGPFGTMWRDQQKSHYSRTSSTVHLRWSRFLWKKIRPTPDGHWLQTHAFVRTNHFSEPVKDTGRTVSTRKTLKQNKLYGWTGRKYKLKFRNIKTMKDYNKGLPLFTE